MKEGLKFGLSVGAFLTVTTYVAGFIWQYAYLGSITHDIQWIKIVTTDYIHIGIMAMLLAVDSSDLLGYLVSILFLVLGVYLFKYIVFGFWNGLSDKGKGKLHRIGNFLSFHPGSFLNEKKVIGFGAMLLLWSVLFVNITLSATNEMAQTLKSDGVDKVCHKDEGCYKGKVLYVGDKQIYFYSFEDKEKITDGLLKLVSVSNWTVTMAWDEKGRDLINQYIDGGD